MHHNCLECHFGYFDEDPNQVAGHESRHDEFVAGVRVVFDFGIVVWRSDAAQIRLVTPSLPVEQQGPAEEVAQIGRWDMPYDSAAYHAGESQNERNVHMFLYQEANRLVGYAQFEFVSHAQEYTWAQWDNCNGEELPRHSGIWSVGSFWVNKSNRRKGIATLLISESARWLNTGITTIGWQDPFTDEAERFLRATYNASFILAK